MSWRLALSLKILRDEVNAAWPDRPKTSDGTVGDAAHANRTSAHNPNASGVVRAFDITAPVGHQVAELIRRSRDPRVWLMISNRRICSAYDHTDGPAWSWRPYSGSNPHTAHAHVEVRNTPSVYDDPSRWLTEEDDMNDDDRKLLREVHEAVYGAGMVSPGGEGPFPDPNSIRGALVGERSGLFAILDLVRRVRATQLGQSQELDLLVGRTADVDVAELAAALSAELGDDLAQALGRRLAG